MCLTKTAYLHGFDFYNIWKTMTSILEFSFSSRLDPASRSCSLFSRVSLLHLSATKKIRLARVNRW